MSKYPPVVHSSLEIGAQARPAWGLRGRPRPVHLRIVEGAGGHDLGGKPSGGTPEASEPVSARADLLCEDLDLIRTECEGISEIVAAAAILHRSHTQVAPGAHGLRCFRRPSRRFPSEVVAAGSFDNAKVNRTRSAPQAPRRSRLCADFEGAVHNRWIFAHTTRKTVYFQSFELSTGESATGRVKRSRSSSRTNHSSSAFARADLAADRPCETRSKAAGSRPS